MVVVPKQIHIGNKKCVFAQKNFEGDETSFWLTSTPLNILQVLEWTFSYEN